MQLQMVYTPKETIVIAYPYYIRSSRVRLRKMHSDQCSNFLRLWRAHQIRMQVVNVFFFSIEKPFFEIP